MITLQNISKKYGERVILNNITLEVESGDMIALMGRSGSGKTTLLNILSLIEKADEGQYYINGKLIAANNDTVASEKRRDDIGVVVQSYALLNNKKVYYNISLPLLFKPSKSGEIRKRVYEIAQFTGIEEHLNKYPYQLSGGECQRVSIARALIRNPKIILADEPTGALDEKTEQNILQLFLKLNKQGTTILLATHNTEVATVCKTIYQIQNEKLINYTL